MNKLILIIFLSITSLNADIEDRLYACIAYMKGSNGQIEGLNMKESITKGGYFRFSVKINFLRAIIYRDRDTINNITYEDMKFVYRDTVKNYEMYVYDYDKEYFLIEKGQKVEPHFSMKLENGDRIYHKCKMYKE